MELNNIEGLLNEIEYLKNKAKLLDSILNYYDRETMSIDIPAKYKNSRVLGGMNKVPKSPRHVINKEIEKLLPYSEHEQYVNYEKLHELL